MKKSWLNLAIFLPALTVWIAAQAASPPAVIVSPVTLSLNPIAGSYNGTISSLRNHQQIGPVQITIDPAIPMPGNELKVGGSVRIVGVAEADLIGSYSPDTGIIAGTISVDSNMTFNMSGELNGTSLVGTITSAQDPSDGAQFKTVLNGSISADEESNSTVPQILRYAGATTNNAWTVGGASVGSPITLTLDESPGSSAQAFEDSILSVSSVVVNVEVELAGGPSESGIVVPFIFDGTHGTAKLDKRNGILVARTLSEGGGTDALECHAVGASDGSGGWSCVMDRLSFAVDAE